jgi:hypothetical protein
MVMAPWISGSSGRHQSKFESHGCKAPENDKDLWDHGEQSNQLSFMMDHAYVNIIEAQ